MFILLMDLEKEGQQAMFGDGLLSIEFQGGASCKKDKEHMCILCMFLLLIKSLGFSHGISTIMALSKLNLLCKDLTSKHLSLIVSTL